jgi:ATP-dependent DNA helicase RecG
MVDYLPQRYANYDTVTRRNKVQKTTFVSKRQALGALLDKPTTQVRGITPEKAALLQKELRIRDIGDLLSHYPYRYVDKTLIKPIREAIQTNDFVLIQGILSPMTHQGAARKKRLVAYLRDDTGGIELVWFQGQKVIQGLLSPGSRYTAYGKITRFNNKASMVHPEMEPWKEEGLGGGLTFDPVYSSTEALMKKGLDTRGFNRCLRQLIQELTEDDIPEILPSPIRQAFRLPGRFEAMRNIHFPTNEVAKDAARSRFKFEELFMIQLELLRLQRSRQAAMAGYRFEQIGEHFMGFYHKHLPFELTNAQKRVVREIRRDLGSGRQMNRLLQGDVGSGKTVVALLAMLIALDNGFQACLVAPTEILARQHFQSLQALVKSMGIRIGFLSGSVTGKARTLTLQYLKSADLHILIGTHAVLEPGVQFNNLGLAITDEQHRFGVEQRAALWRKSSPHPPHILVMTATPIPRTLALTLYGDLDTSLIDELPPGRKPVKTELWYESKRLRLIGFMKEQIALGRQIYVVYPLIEESEKLDLLNLEHGLEQLQRAFPISDFQFSVVHGRMPAQDKDFEMQRFVNKETQIMVATTVIEVGVNVPNASVMIIENAERFGLSQLHQLRGRVGRGADQSYCILMTNGRLSPDARERLKTMCETNDGFRIADVDLKLRGPGDLEGTRQSGLHNLKIADLRVDGHILQAARISAAKLLDEDDQLEAVENLPLRNHLERHQRIQRTWSRIS